MPLPHAADPFQTLLKDTEEPHCTWVFKGRWEPWLIQLKVKGESSKLSYIKKKQECCSCVINQAVPSHGWEGLHLHVSSSSHLGIPLLLGPGGLQAVEIMCVNPYFKMHYLVPKSIKTMREKLCFSWAEMSCCFTISENWQNCLYS